MVICKNQEFLSRIGQFIRRRAEKKEWLSEIGFLSEREMAERCLMAAHGCPPDLEPGCNGFSKDFHSFLPHQCSNQVRFNFLSFDLSLHQKEDWKFTSRVVDHNNLITLDSTLERPTGIQGTSLCFYLVYQRKRAQASTIASNLPTENRTLEEP